MSGTDLYLDTDTYKEVRVIRGTSHLHREQSLSHCLFSGNRHAASRNDNASQSDNPAHWSRLKFSADINDSRRMKPTEFAETLDFKYLQN